MDKGIFPDIHELLAFRHYAQKINFFMHKKAYTNQNGNLISPTRGRGMDFEEVRNYQPGDDIRLIHWQLSARLGKTFVKVYREEREHAVYIVVDQSATMKFGTRVCFKNVLAANIAAALGWSASAAHEQVGGIIFDSNKATLVKAKSGRRSLLNLLNSITSSTNSGHYLGGIDNVLTLLLKTIQTNSTIILISDFYDYSDKTANLLSLLNHKHEIANLLVYDPLEAALPGMVGTNQGGKYSFTADGQQQLEVQVNSQNNTLYSSAFNNRVESIERFSRKSNIQFIKLATNDDIIKKLNQGLIKRG